MGVVLGGADANFSDSLKAQMGVSPAVLLCQQNHSQTVDGSGWSPVQGSFRFCSLTEFGGLTSRGSQTVTEKDWSQALGHFRVHRLYGGLYVYHAMCRWVRLLSL